WLWYHGWWKDLGQDIRNLHQEQPCCHASYSSDLMCST
ncbi:MAG: hypothetical protein AVDCRST_MAG26-751, partial [uncultured Chloroflexia bacterium]